MKSKKLLSMLIKNLKTKEKPMLKLSHLVEMAKQDKELLQSLMYIAKIASDKDTETKFNESVPAADQQDPNAPNNEQVAGQVERPMDNSQVPYDQQVVSGGEQVAEETPEDIGARAAQAFIGQEVFQAAMSGDPNAMELISRVAGQISAAAASAAYQQSQGAQGGQGGFQMSPDMQEAGLTPEEAQAVQEQGGMSSDPNGQGGAVQQSLTPEEQVADLIVAPQAQPTAQPLESPQTPPKGKGDPAPKGGEPKPAATVESPEATKPKDGKDGESIDSETVRKIVNLVKSGKL